MPKFEPVLLANIGKPNSHTLSAYQAAGGYKGLRKVLKEMTPAATIDMVKSSNLRGRGGAGFPTGLKWTFLPKDHPGPIYMCINADESEPATFNNRILMEDDPHQVLEGIDHFLLRHARLDGLYLSALRISALLRAVAKSDRRMLCGRPARQENPRQRIFARYLSPPRRRRLYLRRRDGADRKPRRQAGLAANQAAVPGRRRRCFASRRS